MPLFVVVMLLVSIVPLAAAKTEQEQAVDALFAEWDKNDAPGAALGVFQDGTVIYARGYGMANLEYAIPNGPDSVFRIGSTSKQFTTASIVLLAQQGKLSLDDTLHSFFPDFPEYAKKITVRQLIHHTSGIRDYLMLAYLKGLADEDYYEDKDIMEWLVRQQELNFEPGAENLYSNSGYWLLGQIVNNVAGMSMAEFAEQNIFKPLGMNHTHFHNDHKRIVKNRASGYVPKAGGGYEISMTTLNMIGDGGIFTTINDLKKWDDAFYQSDVLSPAFWTAMTTPGQLNDGTEIDYAGGLLVGAYKGLKTISHGGAFVGFRADMLRFPEQKFTVVVLANRGDARPSSLAHQVADVYLAKDFKTTPEKTESTEKSPAEADAVVAKAVPIVQLVGQYEVQAGVQIKFSVENDRLHAKQLWNGIEYDLQAVPDQVNAYTLAEDTTITFTFQAFENDRPSVMKLIQGGQPSDWKRLPDPEQGPTDLSEFVGDYHSPELDVVYHLRMNGDALTVQVGNIDPVVLNASGPDQLTFQGSVWDFVRDDHTISGFRMTAGRVKNLKFVKQ